MNKRFQFFTSLSIALTLICPLIGSTPGIRVPLVLEFAKTKEERAWGMMGKKHLEENHGMLFIYPKDEMISLWMFNCFLDLSVAFLNNEGKILEICNLKSHPEKMDPLRPVLSLEDFAKYPPGDKIVTFFFNQKITSKSRATMVLEMKEGWFDRKGVKPGDTLIWQVGTPFAEIETNP